MPRRGIAQPLEELGLPRDAAARSHHRLDHDRGQLAGMPLDLLERAFEVVVAPEDVGEGNVGR